MNPHSCSPPAPPTAELPEETWACPVCSASWTLIDAHPAWDIHPDGTTTKAWSFDWERADEAGEGNAS